MSLIGDAAWELLAIVLGILINPMILVFGILGGLLWRWSRIVGTLLLCAGVALTWIVFSWIPQSDLTAPPIYPPQYWINPCISILILAAIANLFAERRRKRRAAEKLEDANQGTT